MAELQEQVERVIDEKPVDRERVIQALRGMVRHRNFGEWSDDYEQLERAADLLEGR